MATLVEIVPYDENWPRLFHQIANDLHRLLGTVVLAIDHVGSTSVPGLSAKPVIDVDITLRGLPDVPAASEKLIASGYEPRGNRWDDDMWAFMQHTSVPKQRVYLCPPGNETHRRRMVFRDYLRAHPDAAAEYAALKQTLAVAFSYDGDRYTAGKRAFVEDILRKASRR